MLTIVAVFAIGAAIGILVQDSHDVMFHVERWLRKRLP